MPMLICVHKPRLRSAALGGVDSMTVVPFDKTYETPDEFSERLARNQLLLKEESHSTKWWIRLPVHIILKTTVSQNKRGSFFLAVEEGGFTLP